MCRSREEPLPNFYTKNEKACAEVLCHIRYPSFRSHECGSLPTFGFNELHSPGRNRYDRCLDSRTAMRNSRSRACLAGERGGPAASHCGALAMVALKHY